ncbi:hypothetical protein G9A89_001811 [Geosiphon pyriformis]|nr:hypothetical protein G9A89_001811 [Geosiphon pyriformis]
MSNKLPPKDDPERAQREREALELRNKAVEVTAAFNEGKLPTTEQLSSAITEVQESEILLRSYQGMSPLGRKVLADTEKLLETVKKLFEEKNANDELQNALFYGKKAVKDIGSVIAPAADIPDDFKRKAEGETSKTGEMIKIGMNKVVNIVKLLVSHPEFRRLFGDINSIVQEAVSRGLSKVDQAIPRKEGSPTEIPVNILDPDVQQKATNASKEAAEEVAGTLELSPERRENIIQRVKNLMLEIHKSKEYQDAISDLVNIVSHISEQTQEMSSSLAKHVEENVGQNVGESIQQSPDLEIAEKNAKELLENFANHRSLDPLINALKEFAEKIRTNEELSQYFSTLKEFVLKSLRDSEFVSQTEYTSQVSKFLDNGRNLLLEHYGDITKKAAHEAAAFNEGLQEDPLTTQLKRDVDTLMGDLFLDETGRPTIKLELVRDLTKIVSIIGDKFSYVALPRIEYEDEENSYIFDNIVLHIPHLVPQHIHLNLTTDINMDRPEDQLMQTTLSIDVTKINADARNIAFFYKKKGLVNFTDVGLIDFSIPEESGGLEYSAKLLLNIPSQGEPSSFRIIESRCKVSELKLRMHSTQHDLLYSILNPLYLQNSVRRQFEKSIEEIFKNAIDFIGEKLSTIQRKSQQVQENVYGQQTAHIDPERLKLRQPWADPRFGSSVEAPTA